MMNSSRYVSLYVLAKLSCVNVALLVLSKSRIHNTDTLKLTGQSGLDDTTGMLVLRLEIWFWYVGFIYKF